MLEGRLQIFKGSYFVVTNTSGRTSECNARVGDRGTQLLYTPTVTQIVYRYQHHQAANIGQVVFGEISVYCMTLRGNKHSFIAKTWKGVQCAEIAVRSGKLPTSVVARRRGIAAGTLFYIESKASPITGRRGL
jgi:hypothetical protein